MESGSLIRVGYWSRGSEGPWPDPTLFMDNTWDTDERDDVAAYLEHGLVARAFMGRATCQVCGATLGNLELPTARTSGRTG